MSAVRRAWLTAAALLCAPAAVPVSASDAMDEEIDFLLESVTTSDCIFIRNEREHDAEDARDHLQMKRERGARHYDNAEEFIERIASRSSWSGERYRVRCGDEEVDAEVWFTELLASYRSRPAG